MYERAGREQDAVVYFDRASAAMLLVRASLHRKLGNREQAEKVFEQALEELKKVDYSRYLQLVKTPRIAGAVVD
jgi:Tfp pilus assembly protein PilF